MLLTKLILRNFKKYRRATIEFQEGLIGIVGSNGAGKSTIVEGIAWALYGNKASAIKRELLKNARANDNEPVEVTLHLRQDHHDLKIYRSMKGKNLNPEATMYINNEIIAYGTKDVDYKLEEILNISYQDFMRTFYARQKDLDNLLKEGGTGKREYLLKLLGLDDIKERAIEQIKSDRGSQEEQKSKLEGALAKIGDVDKKLEEASRHISSVRAELSIAQEKEAESTKRLEKRKLDLNAFEEKRRSHGLLSDRIYRLKSSISEKKETIKTERLRLDEIQVSRGLLMDLEPKLKRLDQVKTRLEILEPKRREYDGLSAQATKSMVKLEGETQLLRVSEERLASLFKDRDALVEIEPRKGVPRAAKQVRFTGKNQRQVHRVADALEGRENKAEICRSLLL